MARVREAQTPVAQRVTLAGQDKCDGSWTARTFESISMGDERIGKQQMSATVPGGVWEAASDIYMTE